MFIFENGITLCWVKKYRLIFIIIIPIFNKYLIKELEVVYLALQGSQNYELDEYSEEYQSDIDTKCIILPTLDDIVCGKSPY